MALLNALPVTDEAVLNGLIDEEARLAPSIQLDREREPQAAQQIGSHHVAEPVLALVDARRSHQRNEEDEKGQERGAAR